MTSQIYSSRPAVGASNELQLSSPSSFRLFSDGVVALNDYEQTTKASALERAKEHLELCVESFPEDVLPRFYLGLVASLLGDMNQDEAIKLFKSVETSRIESIRLPAKYNLAATFIERYDSKGFDEAERLLDEVVTELLLKRKSTQIPVWRRLLRCSRPTEVDELLFQAWAVLLYVKVHKYLWKERRCGKFGKPERTDQ